MPAALPFNRAAASRGFPLDTRARAGYTNGMSTLPSLPRRDFLASAAALAALGAIPARRAAGATFAVSRPVVISSFNGLRATARAYELLNQGFDPADAIVQGVKIMEDDPNDDSVGYGGLPNADGIVELDASVMHGPTHKSGAVAGIRNIKNPAQVALMVLRRTNHCLLVGEGALRFAIAQGFKEENLLTEAARREWLMWKENMSSIDDYLDDAQRDAPVGKTWDLLPWEAPQKAGSGGPVGGQNDGPKLPAGVGGGAPADAPKKSSANTNIKPFRMDVTGTVHCSAVTTNGDIASCTSTSGLNWKIPGRIGDSPIIGAGNYCDNKIGAAGCTGRGEAAIVNLAAFRIVDLMGRGMEPTRACLEVAQIIADHNLEKRHRTPEGRPDFNVKFYALRKDGAFGSAALQPKAQFSICDAEGARVLDAASLYEK
jgi:N4-(beta-N-acetylglucosaminyl)-L-asparaginase